MNLSIYRVLPISGNLFYLLLLKKSEQKIDKKYKNFSLNLLIISTICMLALVGFILYEWLIHLYHLDNYIKKYIDNKNINRKFNFWNFNVMFCISYFVV